MQDPLLFSIVIPTFNRAGFIETALRSALNQDYSHYEIIVVDDGSTDNTEQIVKGIEDSKISYYKIPNSERGAARNFGASKAKGHYLNFFDSDDILYPKHLETALQVVKTHQAPELFHLGYNIVNTEGKLIKTVNNLSGNIGELLARKGNFLSCNGVFVRKDIFDQHKFVENRVLAGSEDFELWARLSSKYHVQISNTVTSSIINHDERSVLNINKEKITARIYLLIDCITSNKDFIDRHGKYRFKLVSNSLSYLALHLAMAGHKKAAFKNLRKSMAAYPLAVFSKKWLVILKFILKP